eukprot:scaffold2191_cov254-Pinguiococcus_pyrenoidosus.AAC.15
MSDASKEEVVVSGFLQKRTVQKGGKATMNLLNSRFFVLTRSRLLYYKDRVEVVDRRVVEKGENPKFIPLEDIEHITVEKEDNKAGDVRSWKVSTDSFGRLRSSQILSTLVGNVQHVRPYPHVCHLAQVRQRGRGSDLGGSDRERRSRASCAAETRESGTPSLLHPRSLQHPDPAV